MTKARSIGGGKAAVAAAAAVSVCEPSTMGARFGEADEEAPAPLEDGGGSSGELASEERGFERPKAGLVAVEERSGEARLRLGLPWGPNASAD